MDETPMVDTQQGAIPQQTQTAEVPQQVKPKRTRTRLYTGIVVMLIILGLIYYLLSGSKFSTASSTTTSIPATSTAALSTTTSIASQSNTSNKSATSFSSLFTGGKANATAVIAYINNAFNSTGTRMVNYSQVDNTSTVNNSRFTENVSIARYYQNMSLVGLYYYPGNRTAYLRVLALNISNGKYTGYTCSSPTSCSTGYSSVNGQLIYAINGVEALANMTLYDLGQRTVNGQGCTFVSGSSKTAYGYSIYISMCVSNANYLPLNITRVQEASGTNYTVASYLTSATANVNKSVLYLPK